MNLTGNVVNMITIFNAIVTANNNCDLSSIFYNAGRLFRVIFIEVEPIEEDTAAGYLMEQHTMTYKILSAFYTAVTTTMKAISNNPIKVDELRNKFEFPTVDLLYSENYHELERKTIFPNKLNPFEDV